LCRPRSRSQLALGPDLFMIFSRRWVGRRSWRGDVRGDRCGRQVGEQLVWAEGMGKQEALNAVAVFGAKLPQLVLVFDAFGESLQPEHSAELDECVDERSRLRGLGDGRYK